MYWDDDDVEWIKNEFGATFSPRRRPIALCTDWKLNCSVNSNASLKVSIYEYECNKYCTHCWIDPRAYGRP